MKPQPQNPKRLLRLKVAADYLSLSPGKLRALVQAGELRVVKMGEGAPWLLDIRDLDSWIERHKEFVSPMQQIPMTNRRRNSL